MSLPFHLGLISSEKPQFLCELLDEIGRMDLSDFVKDYIHKRRSMFLFIVVLETV